MERRLAKLRESLTTEGLDAILLTQPQNRRYISGFADWAGVLLVSAERTILATDFRYIEQAREEAPSWEVVRIENAFVKLLPDLIAEIGAKRIGFESAHLTVAQHRKWREAAEGVELVPTEGMVERLRAIKDAHELETIRAAVALADAAFAHIVDFIQVGMTEREVAWELEVFMRTNGAEKAAFDLIVGSGPNGAKPHAMASERTIQAGEPIVMDLGALLNGYNSDLTRTICLGQPEGPFREVYEVALKAQLAAEKTIKAGLSGSEVHEVARQIIEEAGYGPNFGHGLGHGVGLAVHESPRLSPTSDDVLEAGMVVTVEPGIYLPGWGGVRIEDMVLVEEEGAEVLTQAGKESAVLR